MQCLVEDSHALGLWVSDSRQHGRAERMEKGRVHGKQSCGEWAEDLLRKDCRMNRKGSY